MTTRETPTATVDYAPVDYAPVDYAALLRKYMQSVINEYGSPCYGGGLVASVTPEEAAALTLIESQIMLGI